jgi:hypothetical protein
MRRNRLLFFAAVVGLAAFADIAYVALGMSAVSSFGS